MIEAELKRFDAAMKTAQDELYELKTHIPADAPAEFSAFLDLHRMILNDSALSQAPRELIRRQRANAEWALVQQMERLVERFEEIEDPYLRERKADVQHVVERVLKVLTGARTLATLDVIAEYRAGVETTEPLPFGVWGEVAEQGRVRVGDPVEPEQTLLRRRDEMYARAHEVLERSTGAEIVYVEPATMSRLSPLR